MNAIVKKIVLFKGTKDKREVDFAEGLNIITGDSKTGKSAIIEIVDYCLFASRSTIPKGKISEYVDFFSIIIKIKDIYLIIARPNVKSNNGDKAYFSIETDDLFLQSFDFSYFNRLKLRKIKNDIQTEVEKYFGLSITDTRKDYDEEKQSFGKATIRSAVPFLFQHQNLITSKHSLFYRFDDYYRRKATVNQMPILLGWVDGEYYSAFREYEDKVKQLKAEQKLEKKAHKSDDKLHKQIFPMIDRYYTLIGKNLNKNISFDDLRIIGKQLPEFPMSTYSESDVGSKILELNDQIIPLKNELTKINLQLKKLDDNEEDAEIYGQKLVFIAETVDITDNEVLICPVCNKHSSEVNNLVSTLKESKKNLIDELNKIETYVEDSSEQILFLQNARDSAKKEIRELVVEIEFLKEKNQEIKHNQPIRDQAMITKGAIEEVVKQTLNLNKFKISDTDKLKDDIKTLKKKLDNYNLETKYKGVDEFLERRMNEVCDKLDFEEELRPGRLKFELKTFNFYYMYGNDKILLSEMGSGANWLACHLSLFIALLHLSCKENKSVIPSFLFLDQPSQVYFPKEYKQTEDDVDENIEQVKNIFKVIKDELEIIKKDCDFMPQVVIMDHADEKEFNTYVKKRWSKDGDKLI